MKKIFITLVAVCCFSISYAQSKKEIIQELTIENTNLKQEISVLNNKIQILETEIMTLNNNIEALKKELVVDKVQTPNEYGKTLFDLFASQRLSKYPELQIQISDTIYFNTKGYDSIAEKMNLLKTKNLKFFLEGINNGIDWSKVEFDRFEFEIHEPDDIFFTNYLRSRFYFNFNGNKYSFDNKFSILVNEKWKGYNFENLVNETEKLETEKKAKQKRLNEPYIPRGVKFGGVVYSYNSKEVNPKTMYGLTIPIENNTRFTIEGIKFQFRIYENEILILSKNITVGEYHQYSFDSKLEPGEKEIIELNDIDEVYIGSGVKNNKWSYDVKLLEVNPKPLED